MSNVSPSHGSNAGGGGNHSYSNHHPSSTSSQHHQQSHHPHHSSSQDGLSGMPNTSFDSVSSHHGHQQSSQSHSQSHQSQSQQQQQQQQQQQHNSTHPSSNINQWGPSSQSMHYGSTGATYPSSHGLYSQQGGYYGTQGAHNNGSTNYGSATSAGGPYSGYSMQPHQNAYSLYGSHASQGGNTSSLSSAPNGSTHHSGNSTPNSATPYSHHSHSTNGGMMSSNPGGYYHQTNAGYYGNSGMHTGATTANGTMSQSPSYTSAPQYSTQLPLAGRHRVTTTLWEDEGTLCFQVDARGVCVARRHDNNMINGTKLLNVCGMSRGKRDGILKNEKERVVVKVGAMHLKGVWITFQRGKQLAEQNDIQETLYPLFETNIHSFLYHPDNYPRTAAVMAAAQERQRGKISVGTQSPNGYSAPQRAASHAGQIGGPQQNPPPLMRANTTPNGHLLQQGGPMTVGSGYHQPNGYASAAHHQPQHSPYAQSHSVSSAREMPGTSVDSDAHMNGRLSQSADTSRDDVLDDFKMSSTTAGKPPLHSSNLLNSSYGFSTPGGPIKYQRQAMSDRDNVSRSEAMISMPHSDPLWTHRSDSFHNQ